MIILSIIFSAKLEAQNVSINADGTSPDSSAMLDVSDTTRGVLVPRLTMVQRNAIAGPATGLLIFQMDSDSGFYFNQGMPATPNWQKLRTTSDSAWTEIADSNIYFDDGFVGIGTNTPFAKLHLYGKGSLGAGARMVFGDDYHFTTGGLNTYIAESGWDNNTDSDQLEFHARAGHFFTLGGTTGPSSLDTVMSITPAGRVTIGGTDLAQKLSITSEGHVFTRLQSDTGQVGLWANNDSTGWALFSERQNGSLLQQGAIGLFMTGGSGLAWTVTKDGNMGIGTTDPEDALQIGDFSKAQDQYLSIKTAGGNAHKSGLRLKHFADDDGFTLVSDETQNKFFIKSHNGDTTNVFTIDRITNNVGIGTTSPRKELDVQGSIIASSHSLVSLPTGINYALLANNNGRSLLSSSSGFGSLALDINGLDISFKSGSSNFSNPVKMFLDSLGKLGIGSSTPEGILSLSSASVAGVPGIYLEGFDNTEGDIAIKDGDALQIGEWDGSTFTENVRITGSGRVGINETAPNSMLSIGTTDTDLSSGLNLNNGSNDWYIYQDASQSFVIRDDGNDRLSINSSGQVFLSGELIHASDERLKTNIEPIQNALEGILKLKGVYHYWDTTNFTERGFGSERVIGLIAQDLQAVFPELVFPDKHGFLAVDYSKFSAVLLQAIKEQQFLIDNQNQNNEKQQDQINQLIEQVNLLNQQLKEK